VKICRTCLKRKHDSSFSRAKGNTSGISNRCKACDILYQKTYRQNNKNKVYTKHKNKRTNRKLEAIAILGGRCSMCHKQFLHYCYDFHHIDPSKKEVSISYVVNLDRKTVF